MSENNEAMAAKPLLEKALDIQQRTFGMQHVETARTQRCLGMVLVALGDCQDARAALEQSLAVFERKLGKAPPARPCIRRTSLC